MERELSRGGVVEGEVYTSKKAVTVLAGDTPLTPTVTKLYSADRTDGKVAVNPKKIVIEGTALGTVTKDCVAFKCMDDAVSIPATASWTFEANRIVIDNGDATMATDGAAGDTFSVTITKSGCEAVTFASEIA